MAKEIKERIVLEGEKQYSQAVKEAQRNLRTLKSELKAETAELGKNATEQQKNETRMKSLQKQIKEQEKIVKAYKEALKEVKENYGDNADEIAKWEQKLNNARATLGNMKSDLEGLGSGFKTVASDAAMATVATKSVADSLMSISSAGDSVASAIESVFTGLVSKCTEAAEALWNLISETAARANNWTDLASYYGSSAQDLQMWSRAIEAAGGSFETFQGIINKMAFGGKEKSITELLGVSKENYQDDVKYTLAVLDALEKKKEELGQGWYDNTMAELFGARKSADVSWFLANAHGHQGANGEWINGWRDNPERFNGDQGGLGMTEEELQTMNDLYVVIQNIETKWQALKDSFAAGLGMASLDLLVNVEGTLDGVADFLNAKNEGEREQALEKIKTNLEEFFRKLGDVIREALGVLHEVGEELQNSDDPVTKLIGDILVKLTESLQWMIDNADAVKSAFETIFGIWLIAKLASVAGKLGSIITQIETIKTFKGLSGVSGAASGIASGAASGAAGAAGAAAGGGLLAKIGAGLAKAAPVLAGLLVWGENALKPQGNSDLVDESGNITEDGKANGLYLDSNGNIVQKKTGDTPWSMNGKLPEQLLPEYQGTVTPAQREAAENFWDVWRRGPNGYTEEEFDTAWAAFEKAFEGNEDTFDKLNAVLDKFYEQNDSNGTLDQWPDLTSSWWKTRGFEADENGITQPDMGALEQLPGQMKQAVLDGMGQIVVKLDGRSVGVLVAPYVSQQIATELN